jgi:hypothetical protein
VGALDAVGVGEPAVGAEEASFLGVGPAAGVGLELVAVDGVEVVEGDLDDDLDRDAADGGEGERGVLLGLAAPQGQHQCEGGGEVARWVMSTPLHRRASR